MRRNEAWPVLGLELPHPPNSQTRASGLFHLVMPRSPSSSCLLGPSLSGWKWTASVEGVHAGLSRLEPAVSGDWGREDRKGRSLIIGMFLCCPFWAGLMEVYSGYMRLVWSLIFIFPENYHRPCCVDVRRHRERPGSGMEPASVALVFRLFLG